MWSDRSPTCTLANQAENEPAVTQSAAQGRASAAAFSRGLVGRWNPIIEGSYLLVFAGPWIEARSPKKSLFNNRANKAVSFGGIKAKGDIDKCAGMNWAMARALHSIDRVRRLPDEGVMGFESLKIVRIFNVVMNAERPFIWFFVKRPPLDGTKLHQFKGKYAWQ